MVDSWFKYPRFARFLRLGLWVVTACSALETVTSQIINVFQKITYVYLRPNTSICPCLSAAIFVCAENVVNMGVVCTMANFMFYIGTHSIGTCASLLHIIIIIIIIIIIVIIIITKPLLKIFNECRSLKVVG